MILRILNYLKQEIQRSQQHQGRGIILPVLWKVYDMARVTILNFRHQLRKPKAHLNVSFSFLLGTLVMELIIYHFWRNYRASGKEGQGGVSHSQSLSIPLWGSAGKF